MRSCGTMWIACVLALCVGVASGCAFGQVAAPPGAPLTDPATEDALHALARLAGVIFTGQVVAVRRHVANDGAAGVVEIEFAVDDAIRGTGGGSYTLREWAGLWAAGDEPFRVGQRYLMLLHAAGAAGLSSPVGGMDGAIPIRGGTTVDSRTVDLRWIRTRVVQPIGYRAAPVARPTARLPASRVDDAAAAISSTQTAGYRAVLSKLRNWERDDATAR
jgi:hypothetical protein